VKIFELFGDVLVNDKASGTLDNIGKSAKGLSSKMGESLAKIAKIGAGTAVALGTTAAAFSAKAISMGADAEEMMNKYNVVFSGMTDTVDAWTNDFASKVGRSRLETKEFLSNIADLTQGLGMTKEASFGLASQIVELGTDLA